MTRRCQRPGGGGGITTQFQSKGSYDGIEACGAAVGLVEGLVGEEWDEVDTVNIVPFLVKFCVHLGISGVVKLVLQKRSSKIAKKKRRKHSIRRRRRQS